MAEHEIRMGNADVDEMICFWVFHKYGVRNSHLESTLNIEGQTKVSLTIKVRPRSTPTPEDRHDR